MLIEFKRPQLEDKEVISEYFWNYPLEAVTEHLQWIFMVKIL